MQVQGADSFLHSRYSSPIDCALKSVKSDGVRNMTFSQYNTMKYFLAEIISLQLTGIFRGGCATFLRESIGNAVFFSTYEYVRYYMHKPLRDSSSDLTHVIDVGVGIVSGGFGGIAVSITFNHM